MKSYEERFPALYQFLGCYFHQDWKDFSDWKGQAPSFEGIVRHFKVIDSKTNAKEELNELISFLSLNLAENEIEDVMDEWNIAYYPYGIKITYKEWLERILEILEEPIEKTKKEFIPDFIG
jgi:CdiI immunity protein